ncbi:MAG: SET domain-containing protein-lysine N-methyltransferase [Candidatus Pacearchaeota archaeon]|nr:SET domain-containing protein-lysine N-methyltransferase [Candidatus Pacearchaeota archaeon]
MKENHGLILIKGSSIHGRGIFAKKEILKNKRIIEYVGEKITKKQSDKIFLQTLKKASKDKTKGEVYLFDLNKKYDINGDVPKNTAKYINHSCNPNCETEIIDDKEIWVVSKRKINIGEELSFNYGFGLEEYKDYPCKCNSPNCMGYILDKKLWPKMQK